MRTFIRKLGVPSLINLAFIGGVLCALLSSCSDSDMDHLGGDDLDKNKMIVNYSILSPITRTTGGTSGSGNENELKEIALVFYDNTTGDYAAHSIGNTSNSGASNGSVTIVFPNTLTAGSTYKVLAVANYNEHLPTPFQTTEAYISGKDALSYTEIQEEMLSGSGGKSPIDYNRRTSTPLPFSGEGSVVIPTDPSVQASVAISFKRTVARIDVSCISDKLDIKWVKVANYYNQGYMFNSDLLPGSPAILVRGTALSTPSNGRGVVIPNGVAGAQSLEGGIYCYPNTSAYPVQNDERTTCVIVAGIYKGDDANNTEVTYYRANIAAANRRQVLKRNSMYRLTINKVTAAGSETEEGAMSDAENKLDYDINDWEEDDSGGNIITDATGNFILVSRTDLLFEKSAGAQEPLQIKVKDETSWTAAWHPSDPSSLFLTKDITPSSLTIRTRSANPENGTRRDVLRISLVENPTLYLDVFCSQLGLSDKVSILKVDGQMGVINIVVPASGKSYNLKVETGDVTDTWAMKITTGGYPSFITSNTVGNVGAHNGMLSFTVAPNQEGGDRNGQIVVNHANNSSVPNVTINFKQRNDPTPIVLNREWMGEHHLLHPARMLNYSEQYTVTIKDAVNYPTWRATSNIDLAHLSIAAHTATTAAQGRQTITQNHGTAFKVFPKYYEKYNVPLAPGENLGDISGTITIEALPKAGSGVDTLRTNYDIILHRRLGQPNAYKGEFVRVSGYYIYDRNVGAIAVSEANPIAKNYTTDTGKPDNANAQYRGTEYKAPVGTSTLCPSGWKVPTHYNNKSIGPKIRESKGRYFVIDELYKVHGVFYPLSGGADDDRKVFNRYICSDYRRTASGQQILHSVTIIELHANNRPLATYNDETQMNSWAGNATYYDHYGYVRCIK